MRLIDADALKKAFCNHCDGDEPCTEPCVDIGLIETAPTIDAVPVRHAFWYWKDETDWNIGAWRCSACHNRPNTIWGLEKNLRPRRLSGSAYCPNCGAVMDGKEKTDATLN